MVPGSGARGRLLIVVNSAAFFLSHRLPVARAAQRAGWQVHVATAPDPLAAARIRQVGLQHHAVPLDRGGLSPLRDLQTFAAIYRLMRRLRPDVVHTVTVKPVVWGGIAARLAGLPGRLSAVPGLGYISIAPGFRGRAMRFLVGRLYRLALGGRTGRVLFQNDDDRRMLESFGVPLKGRCALIRGSGVDLKRFHPQPEPAGRPVVLMAARMLLYKGVAEFVAAARLLRAEGLDAAFRYAGAPDPDNPDSVPPQVLAEWLLEGDVHFLGRREDMDRVIAESHLVILPSRSEGVPKVLIEAAATGRAIVTCDAPGCRDAIEDGVTGLTVPVGDVAALADAIRALVRDPERRRSMGTAASDLAAKAFDVNSVIAEHLRLYDSLAPRAVSPIPPVARLAPSGQPLPF